MRSRKALKNTFAGILYEATALICGFVGPRLILGAFGSDYNGITSSITQFLSCVVLFKTSIAGVTRVALYKPLSESNDEEISGIMRATELFIRKVALIFAISMLAFSVVYPFLVREDFDWLFSASLVLILGITTFVQYYFGVTYQILLEADQKQGFLYLVQIFTTILNTILAAFLIKMKASIHIVKLGSAVAFSLNPILINWYVHKNYRINKSAPPNRKAIKQRWDAFGQATAAFVHNNTDMVVLTIFSSVYEVSVYTVYYMVCNGLKTLLKTFTSSIGAAFGNMMAKGEKIAIQKNMDIFEYVAITCTTVIFTVAGIMMLPFVSVYTKGVTDVEYVRPLFSVLMVVGMAFFCYRIPYQAIVEAAGHYKQTRNGAMFEAVANIIISIGTVIKFGLIGVAIGTLFANIFRTVQYVSYLQRNILNRSPLLFFKQMATSFIVIASTVVTCRILGIMHAESYISFAINTAICFTICVLFSLIVTLLFYRTTFYSLIKMFKRSLKRNK